MGPARCPAGADSPQPTGRRRAWASPAFYHAADQRAIASRANVFIFCRSTKPACFFLAVERSPPGPRASIEARAKGWMRQPASLQAAPATIFVAEPSPGPTQPGPNALPRFRPKLALLPGGWRDRPASFWRWNGARQTNELPPRPEQKVGCADTLTRGPRPPQLSLPDYALARRGQGRTRNAATTQIFYSGKRLTASVRGGRRFRNRPEARVKNCGSTGFCGVFRPRGGGRVAFGLTRRFSSISRRSISSQPPEIQKSQNCLNQEKYPDVSFLRTFLVQSILNTLVEPLLIPLPEAVVYVQ